MTRNAQPAGACLSDDDFYRMCTGSIGTRSRMNAEAHLAECAWCRSELAGILKVLHPEAPDAVEPAPGPGEIESTLALIRDVVPAARRRNAIKWTRWAAAAAVALLAIGLGAVALLRVYERQKSAALCAQGRAMLQDVYAPQSPSELRIDLPFHSTASERSAESPERLDRAEGLFNQALGVRRDTREALLGLAYIQLTKRKFADAQNSFQQILEVRPADVQALLGRGISRFETAMASADPSVRESAMEKALQDFARVLELNPSSNEATFDQAQTLFELGRHREAAAVIERYLSRDPDSVWALKLRKLKSRIQMSGPGVMQQEAQRAARARDSPVLEDLVSVFPQSIPSLIRTLLLESLTTEGPDQGQASSDLQWAASILEAAYRRATGDSSYARLLAFYAGLSPAERRAKRTLDIRLEQLVTAFSNGQIDSIARRSAALERGFAGLEDYWQLVRVYQLRGTAFYYGKPDFSAATAEYARMLRSAESASDPDLIARSLAAMSSSQVEDARYDDSIATLARLRRLAQSQRFGRWNAFASSSLGAIYLKLNQPERSLQEYSAALADSYRVMDAEIIVASLENLGQVMERLDRDAEAAAFYRKCGDYLRTDGARVSLGAPEFEARSANLLCKQGYLSLKMKDVKGSEHFFRQALERSAGMREVEARSRLGLAQTCVEQNRVAEAAEETDRVLHIVSLSNYPEVAWRANSLKGHLLKRMGDTAGALKHYQRSVRLLDSMRRNVSLFNSRESFFVRRFNPFREVASLLFRLRQDPEQIRRYSDQAKAITLQEYMTRAGPARGSGPLPDGMTTLEYFATDDELLVFRSDSGGTRVASVALRASELDADVHKFLESIRANNFESFAALSRKLHRLLVGGFLSEAKQGTNTLVIIPDGPLCLLPFASLMDPAGHYLVEALPVSYAPSRDILRLCLGKQKTRTTTNNSMLLLDGSANLSSAAQELAYLSQLYRNNSRLADGRDLSRLRELAGDFELIHFAGHARLTGGRPALVLQSLQGETYLDASAIGQWDLKNNSLVMLAGCSTGVGPRFDGEAPWGLLPAFLSAGAPAVIVSLLPVGDKDTRRFTCTFYEVLSAHSPRNTAAALRQAQLELIRHNASPASWAPFVLVGDPR